ncbi:unnamed protein product, partial [Trichogramma brassicae]
MSSVWYPFPVTNLTHALCNRCSFRGLTSGSSHRRPMIHNRKIAQNHRLQQSFCEGILNLRRGECVP